MVCRAPTNAATCAGPSPTGAQLQYDAEERLASWQNAPSSPTTTASYLYDGAGERVAQQVTSGGTTTTTAYLGGNEEVATTGSGTTTTTYYAVAGRLIALAVNGSFSYLADDGLGSVNVALDASGNPQAAALYRPYGTPRYSSGSMPGSYGFTGQHSDAAVTGLDYHHARYYDPAAGVFTTADNLALTAKGVSQGQARELLNRYTYVGEDPETRTDPSGHSQCLDAQCTRVGSSDKKPSGSCSGWRALLCVGADILKTMLTQGTHDAARLAIIAAISTTFQDPLTEMLLYTLLRSPLGAKFVAFFLEAGKVYGDQYITWRSSGPAGYNDQFGFIQLNANLLSAHGGGTVGLVTAASVLVHEGVESYYSLAWGIRGKASRHMDYVAQVYANTVLDQLNNSFNLSITHDGANQESFTAWDDESYDGGKASYGNEDQEQWEVTNPLGIATAALFANPLTWVDPMGIQPNMLSPTTDKTTLNV